MSSCRDATMSPGTRPVRSPANIRPASRMVNCRRDDRVTGSKSHFRERCRRASRIAACNGRGLRSLAGQQADRSRDLRRQHDRRLVRSRHPESSGRRNELRGSSLPDKGASASVADVLHARSDPDRHARRVSSRGGNNIRFDPGRALARNALCRAENHGLPLVRSGDIRAAWSNERGRDVLVFGERVRAGRGTCNHACAGNADSLHGRGRIPLVGERSPRTAGRPGRRRARWSAPQR